MTVAVLKRQAGPKPAAKIKPGTEASRAKTQAYREARHHEIGELLARIQSRAESLSVSADRLLARLT